MLNFNHNLYHTSHTTLHIHIGRVVYTSLQVPLPKRWNRDPLDASSPTCIGPLDDEKPSCRVGWVTSFWHSCLGLSLLRSCGMLTQSLFSSFFKGFLSPLHHLSSPTRPQKRCRSISRRCCLRAAFRSALIYSFLHSSMTAMSKSPRNSFFIMLL